MMGESIFHSLMPLSWLSSSVCLRLATTLLHSLWQASVIAGIFAAVEFCLRRGSSNVRYWSGVVSLGLIAICSIVTFGIISTVNDAPATQVAALRHVPEQAASVLSTANELPASRNSSLKDSAEAKFVDGVLVRHDAPFAKVASWTTAIYLFGVVVMSLRLVIAVATGWRMRWNAVEVVDDRVCEVVRRVAARWAIRAVPVVAYCHRVSVPVITGTLRPVILIPPAMMSGLTIAQVEWILAHELAHLRRGDLLINWLQRVVEAMFFFHPAVWYLSHRVSFERECTCDDLVVASGCPAFEYAEALVLLAEVCGSKRMRGAQFAALLAATGKRPSQLKYRLLRLLDQPPPYASRMSVGGVAATALLFGMGLIGLLHPQEGRSSDGKGASLEAVVAHADEPTQTADSLMTAAASALAPVRFERTVEKEFASGEAWFESEISKVAVEGNSTIPESTIMKQIKTRSGHPINFEQIRNDVDALMRTRWFVRVEPKLRPCEEGTALVFCVTERPIVSRVEYMGLKKVKQKVFDAMTQLKPGSPFDVSSNRECARRIEEYYHEKGFAFAAVELEKGNRRDDREVVFAINEGPKVHVTAIEFDEKQMAADDMAQGKSRHKTRILKLCGGKYDPSTMKDDRDGILRYYYSLGYLDVVIEPILTFSEGESNLELYYDISEGLRYKIGKIKILGNNVLSEQELRSMIDVHVGDHFNLRDITRDVDRIRSKYLRQGRLFCRVDAIPCMTAEKGAVDLEFKIYEDRVYRIRNFEAQGELAHFLTRLGSDVPDRSSDGEIVDDTRLERLRELSKRADDDLRKKDIVPFMGPVPIPIEWDFPIQKPE